MSEELDSAVIDVDPEYQHEIVWTGEHIQFGHHRSTLTVIAERMTGLVNSLMGIVSKQRQSQISLLTIV